MHIVLTVLVTASLIAVSNIAIAEEITQVTTAGGKVTTTIESATGSTQITTSPGQSIITRSTNGSKIEMDSDNSVYVVYPDGARVAAPDGITTLIDGSTITVKDGKRIP